MEVLELILIIAGIIALIIGIVAVIQNCVKFFRQKYGFSVWSGVLFLIFGIVIVGYDITHYMAENMVLLIVGGLLFLLTLIQDIRLAKWMGICAFILQMFLSLVFIALIALAVFAFIIKTITKRSNAVIDYLTGTTRDFREGIMMLPQFLRL